MITCIKKGLYVLNGSETVTEPAELEQSRKISKHEASRGTLSYRILSAHETAGDSADKKNNLMNIKFDALASHDITYVGIIQTVRAACPEFSRFPIPYILTNCHNSLCAVGGTTNEDDHVFGLSAVKKYGGVYVPAHIAVIHQYMREAFAGCGKMILGSDSHTRYGALGTMGFGEGGGELVKQLLGQTYDIPRPEVIGVRLLGTPRPGVGPQDVALALIGEVFESGYVKNKVLEFFGPGVANLSVDFRMGIDVMTTETACLSSIWTTDSKVEEYLSLHGRAADYKDLSLPEIVYYDGLITIDLSQIVPMIAMPFHPSHVYTITEAQKNAADILRAVEKSAEGVIPDFSGNIHKDGIHVDQGIIAGCAGGLYESLSEASEILGKTGGTNNSLLNDAFSLSIYPASQPMYLSLVENGIAANLLRAGAIIKTAFCGPCFGAGDVPRHNGLSIRHTTRNFPNREGAKPSLGQSAAVALMDARSIAATALNGGVLTAADTLCESKPHIPKYYFNSDIYKKRVYDGRENADPSLPLIYASGIRDWPVFRPVADDILLNIASLITDPVTTTDELIPSGETSAFRSNPYALAEYTLSRKDPEYAARAKKIAAIEKRRLENTSTDNEQELQELFAVVEILKNNGFSADALLKSEAHAVGSAVYANKPGDGSAREQAASCQRVLGGIANIAAEYATKRYRSNLINWGIIPFILPGGITASQNRTDDYKFKLNSYIYVPGIREAVKNGACEITAYTLDISDHNAKPKRFTLEMPQLTFEEREILLAGCLINHYKKSALPL